MYRIASVALVLALLAACGAPTPAETPPPGWARIESRAGDLEVVLPPWMAAFEMSGPIFANEVLPDGTPGMQLLAEGPLTAELQPAAGESLEAWLAARIEAPGAGEPRVERVRLSAGEGIRVRRDDRAGTATAWRIAAWAIRTRAGVAFLLVDGAADRWLGREEDVERIARLLSVPPSVRASP
jgi:hypothetical protein